MSELQGLMSVDGALLALSGIAAALAIAGKPMGAAIYVAALALCLVGFATAAGFLLGREPLPTTSLPRGLPWIGAHFRLDALSAFFIALIDFGGAIASLYAIG